MDRHLFLVAVDESALAMETVSPAYTEGSVLLDAIENNDASIHFSEHEDIPDNRIVNQALNRVASILYNVKSETAQQEKYYELILDCINTGILVLNDAGAVYQKITKPFAC